MATIGWSVLTALAATALVDLAHQDGAEPPLQLVLHVGWQKIDVTPDRPFEVTIDGKKVAMHVAIRPTRRLRAPGFEFDYPVHFAFKFDRNKRLPRWHLSGSTTKFMLQQMPPTDPNAQAESAIDTMRKQLPGATVDADERTLLLGGKEYKGRRIRFEVTERRYVLDVYIIDTERGVSALSVQDQPDAGGNPSTETVKALEILQQTFTISPAAGK